MSLSTRRRARAASLAMCLTLAACPHPRAAAPTPPPAGHEGGRLTAVLINGGGNKQSNFQSHLTHVRTLVGLLHDAGLRPNDITVFASDGSDPAADLATRDRGDPGDQCWLLPPALADQLRPVEYVDSRLTDVSLLPATQTALQTWFATAGKALRSGDTLLLYVTDHGELNRQNPANNSIVLWHETLSVAQLRELLGQLAPGVRVVMLMSQCFSGAFAHAMFDGPDSLAASGRVCGFFASSADRPAYGCYPENLGRDGVGHSFHFLAGLHDLGRMSEAQRRVLVTDDSPDVPNTTSDFYLHALLTRAAEAQHVPSSELIDALIHTALRQPADCEPEIRQLDRVGAAFGMFSPRSLGELAQQAQALPEISAQLHTYAERWSETLQALQLQNFKRFVRAQPRWRAALTPSVLASLDTPARRTLAAEVCPALATFTAADHATAERLNRLRQRAAAATAAAYRMEVRLGVGLRLRALLDQIAGRVYLDTTGTTTERQTYAALRACEETTLPSRASANSAGPQLTSADMPAPAAFPSFDADRQAVAALMPAWMGITFRPLAEAAKTPPRHAPGAVAVVAVYPGAAAAKAGLAVGDIILGPPGMPFQEPHQVREWTMQRQIGEPAPLVISRAGQTRRIVLRPEPFPLQMPELSGPPAVGSLAPALKLQAFRGAPTLAAGRPRLLFFWATWCLPCKLALPEVMALAAARHLQVVAITDEQPETLTAFFHQLATPFPQTVAIDPYRATFQAYGVSGTPTFVLLGADNRVQYYATGYDPSKGLAIDGWTSPTAGQRAGGGGGKSDDTPPAP